MRRLAWLGLIGMACLACGCPQHKGSSGGSTGGPIKAHVLSGLPADWPLPQLTLPDGAKGFEGRVGEAADGTSKDYTAYFTSTEGWENVMIDVESKLRQSGYVLMNRDPGYSDPGGKDVALAAPDGTMLVVLSYDEDKQSQATVGTPGYYTLLVKQMKTPVKVEQDWKPL